MIVSAKIMRVYFLLIVFLQSTLQTYAQPSFPVKDWVKQLNSEKISGFKTVKQIVGILSKYDSSTVANTFSKMDKEGKSAGNNFHLRMQHLRIWHLQQVYHPYTTSQIQPLLDKLLNQAYETGDKKLIAYASWVNAHLMDPNNNAETILMHKLRAIDLFDGDEASENLGKTLIELGEHLFHTREYRQCIEQLQQGLKIFRIHPEFSHTEAYKNYNTIGQAYQQMGIDDSAMYYFESSMQAAKTVNDTVWQSINALYMGQINDSRGKSAAAKTELYFAYATNKFTEPTIAASALNWLGKIAIREKNLDSAQRFLDEGFSLLKNSHPGTHQLQVKNFLQQVYGTKAEFYRTLNKQDSADFYSALQIALKDSLQTVASNSNSKMAQLRFNNEKTRYAFLSLKSEKAKEEQTRNFIIIIISLIAIVSIIVLNRQKKVLKYKQELSLAQKAALMAEAEAAREQLQLFTHSLVEKTELLESLQKQVSDKSASKEQQEWLHQLSTHTILTDDDWGKFKTLFEKIYPGFFIQLKKTFPEITGAEQRMSALSLLHLTAAQIAAILGISVNSVHKTRQRLRIRLKLSDETNLEAFLAQL